MEKTISKVQSAPISRVVGGSTTKRHDFKISFYKVLYGERASLGSTIHNTTLKRTEWSPIRSVIRFVNHECDYRPHRTTVSPLTN